jgi:hypothetical protein
MLFDDDDFSIFQEELGEDVTFHLSGGNTVECKAIFDNEFLAAEMFGLVVETSGPVLSCKSSDIEDVAVGDTVEVTEYGNTEATTFSIVQLQPDGTGQTLVVLGYYT